MSLIKLWKILMILVMIVSCIDWTKIKCRDPKRCNDLKFRLQSYHVSIHLERKILAILKFYFL